MSLCPFTPDLIKGLNKGRKFFQPGEIRWAKRILPLTKLMRHIGDAAFICEQRIATPFHPSEGATFRIKRKGNRTVFSCCQKCGHSGDQIDYLLMRFQIGKGCAIALFCKLAGTRPATPSLEDRLLAIPEASPCPISTQLNPYFSDL